MIRPSIHGCNFPYRGPKNRTDVNGLLTSAKYDAIKCQEYLFDLDDKRIAVLDYFGTHTVDSIIEKNITTDFYKAGVPITGTSNDFSLDNFSRIAIDLSTKITGLLFS